MERRKTWGENRVYYHDESGNLRRIATQWTSLAAADAFVMISAGRSSLRVEDLLQLVGLVEQQRSASRPKRLNRRGKDASSK